MQRILKKISSYCVQFLLLSFMGAFGLQAQRFPVQVTPQVIPPYSLKLSDYGTASPDRLIVNLLLIDVNETNREVGLRLYIESNDGVAIRSTDPVVGANPIRLDGGIPLRLTNADLQAYFSLQNLVGISPQQYNTTLPEGLYRFCFEVYDYLSGQVISRKSCATAYLVLNDPPFLNLPNRGEVITEREPQNIIFQWTPRHLNATNVQYEFTLAELWDTQMDPQAAFLASRPLFQTTTFATTLLYGPGETSLLPDKMYAWRVRAIVSDGISETSVFRNDGYSEIYHFTYTGNCAEPSFVLAEGTTPTTEQVMWQGEDHLKYRVQYRKKGVENAVWFEVNAFNERASIYNLEPGTTYEFRVGGQCMENMGFTYSQIYEFTTMIAASDTATYNCGITPEVVITNQEPLQALVINDVFTAGDFPVTVKFVGSGNVTPTVTDANNSSLFDTQSMNSNGVYSGWGFITVPYLQNTKIKVSFNEISINSDYQLIGGMVVTDYDENWGGVDDVQDEIDAIVDLLDGGILDILEDIVDRLREGELTGEDIESVLDEIRDDITEEIFEEAQELQEQISELEDQLNDAQTEEDKENIQEQIDELQEELADTLDQAKEEIIDLIVKAIEKYYNQNRSKESELVASYDSIYENQENNNIENNGSDLDEFEFDFEEEIEIETIPEEFKETFEVQKKYHLYFFAKALALNKENKKEIRFFIKKALEAQIDLPKLLKVAKDNNDNEDVIVDVLVEGIDNAIKSLIDTYKYNFLEP
ncbi:MAG: hypothetical protein CL613_00565 [Aquimarina sp.]|nr:hypothetical protein [Aquimarina sp.]